MTTTPAPSTHYFHQTIGRFDRASVMHCNGNVMLYVDSAITPDALGKGAHLTVTEARTLAAHLIAAADALAPVCYLTEVRHTHSTAYVVTDAEGTCLADAGSDWSEAWDAADAWATANGYRFDCAAGTRQA